MWISQELFDETLVESQELFEYADDRAVQETISELQSSSSGVQGSAAVRLDHLSLTHPNSDQGKADRKEQTEFCQLLQDGNLLEATDMIRLQKSTRKSNVMLASLVLQRGHLAADSTIIKQFDCENPEELQVLLSFLLALLPDATTAHPLARELKLMLSSSITEHWCRLFEQHPVLRLSLIRWARASCNACEPNKKVFVQTALDYNTGDGNQGKQNGLDLLLGCLPKSVDTSVNSKEMKMLQEISQLITILGKFQALAEPTPKDGQAPMVSSAHANVKELYRSGAVFKLHQLAQQCTDGQHENLLCDLLSALRVMAIDNDIVQNMVAVGLLQTASKSLLSNQCISPPLAAATLGLLRNLCANDEIKTTVCHQSLSSILHVLESHPDDAAVQEHGCGILGAMALRQPQNAVDICQANGSHYLVAAMRRFPMKVPLQRQACLALRNLAVRLPPEQKQTVLDTGAEAVLREIASLHQGSIEEAYAALRDLGLPAVMYKVDEHGKAQGTQVFGQVQSNFRPVYE